MDLENLLQDAENRVQKLNESLEQLREQEKEMEKRHELARAQMDKEKHDLYMKIAEIDDYESGTLQEARNEMYVLYNLIERRNAND